MAISITTLKGTNSLSADRITINDNFNVNTNAINELIGILNTTTGKFVRTKRIVMTPDEVDQQNGYWRNHRNVEKKFAKQMMGIEDGYWDSKYRVMRVRKA